MCDPVSIGFMAVAMIAKQQEQQAQQAAVNQQNEMARQNEEMQIAGMKRDMGALHDEQINLAEADFEDAESAADAKLQLSIDAKRKESSIVAMNFENLGGGGQTSDSILANHRRGTLGSLNDIENNFLSGLKKRKTAWDNLERDKHNRWYTAKSNIMSLPRSGSQSASSKMFGIGTAAVSGYGTGRSIQRKQPADPTKTG